MSGVLENAKQEEFCRQYIVDWIGAAAARRAKYSEDTAAQIAYELLQRADVRARIDELAREHAGYVRVEAERLLRELLYLATVDVADLLDEKGRLRTNLRDVPEHARRAITQFKVRREHIGDDDLGLPISETFYDVKFAGKEKALEMLSKYKKLFDDGLLSGVQAVNIHINGVRKAGTGA